MKKLNIKLEEITDLYKKGLSCQKIADQLNVSEPYISKRLRLAGYKKRSLSEAHYKSNIKHSFFNDINTEEKAYWLGFLYADGCIMVTNSKHKNGSIYTQYKVALTSKDKEALEKFSNSLNINNTCIKTYKSTNGFKTNNPYHFVSITSKELFDGLNKHGCVQRKSLILEFPDLNQDMISHFIRGYFDGDGSVTVSKIVKKSLSCYKNIDYYLKISNNICGTYKFLNVMRTKLPFINQTKGLTKKKRKKTNCWSLRFHSLKSLNFYDYIYKDATVYLSRKKNKFENYIKERCSTTIISNPSKVKRTRRIKV